MIMTNLEFWLLKKLCKDHDLDIQEIDLKLTYYENKKILHEIILYEYIHS